MRIKEEQPLLGKRILITRTKDQAVGFARKISDVGGIPIIIPLLSIQRVSDLTTIRHTVKNVHHFDWLMFTSQNGVHVFFQFAQQENVSFDQFQKIKIAVVGNKTLQALETYGLTAKVMPDHDYTAEGMVEALAGKIGRGDRVLLARGNLARTVLPESLREFGAEVIDLIVYNTVINRESQRELIERLKNKEIDVITFTSSSTVHFFVELIQTMDWRSLIQRVCLAAIGPITADTMAKYGLEADVIAAENTMDGLLAEMIDYFYKTN